MAPKRLGSPRSPHTTTDGSEALQALSWHQVDEIVARIDQLNPYDREAVPSSLLEIETINRDDQGDQREILAFAVSAKRYMIYEIAENGQPRLLEWKEHGLGVFLSPDGERGNKAWIREVLAKPTRRPLHPQKPSPT